jgi:hypothetical protein
MFKSFLDHRSDALGGDMFVVEHALELESLEGIGDVRGGADGGEDLVEHTTRLDVLTALQSLLIVALNELAAAVALLEIHLTREGAHSDGDGRGGLEERIV